MALRSSGGRINPSVRLTVTLCLLSGAAYHDLMMLFRMGRSTVFQVFFETICAMTKRLRLPGITFDDEDKLDELAMGFSRKGGSPLYGCVGAVDGIAIKIMKPLDEDNPASYWCRKGFYCIPVQAIADYKYRFTYISAVCLGSRHDSTAWNVSKLGIMLNNSAMRLQFWLAGDAAYDCGNGVVTPWPLSKVNDPRSEVERDAFNYYHSSTRIHVEQAFGTLVSRFGILWKPVRFHLRKVPIILHACMILRSFCIDNSAPRMETAMT
jgi:hypothetical protein